jgi:type III pantothenate kinase
MMNLVIDIGNSRTKTAIFENAQIRETETYDVFDTSNLNDILKSHSSINNAILSSVSVSSHSSEIKRELSKRFSRFIELTPDTLLPVENLYKTKETLGLDRLAAAIGANLIFPESDILVIDAGTAITFDFIDKNKRFLGGNISPGLDVRFRALNEYTGKLPRVSKSESWPLLGTSTSEAIQAGVQNGILFEVDSMIDRMKATYPELKVVITGGDAMFFDRKLKNTIFVKFEITLMGLNRILEYNVENI